jgi:hypothetical protein
MSIDDELKAIVLENAKSIRELKESQKETSEQMKKTDEKLKSIGIHLGGISNNQGDVAEEFFYNSLKHKPRLAGIDYDFIDKNITRQKDGIEDEYDILLVNGKDVAIIEIKYKAHPNDLDRLINKKYPNFKKLYPEYKDYNHHLGLASFNINDDLKQKALSNNIMILQRKGEVIETILP